MTVTQLLKEYYGLNQLCPAPVRVKGLHRTDIARIINLFDLKKGAEVGVRGGLYSEILCQNISGVELLCVDPWKEGAKKYYKSAVNRLKPYNATLVKKTSIEAAEDVPFESLDFVYIDANHNFDFIMEDLIIWGRRIRSGGIIAGHDYDKTHDEGVVPAVNIYTKIHMIGEWFVTDQKRKASFFWMKQ